MIENAAKLAKLESVQKLEKKKLDLRVVIERAMDEAKPMLREAEMVVENRVVQPITINANPVIEEVFTNLLTNAAKYAGEGKRVVIEAEEGANQVKIMVKDYGPGVPDEDKERIFRRFERKEKGGIKGIGLGLAIVKRIVELHNGKVWVEDNPEGGSIFWVQLPKGRGE
jgi:signal transduction histidine kinase